MFAGNKKYWLSFGILAAAGAVNLAGALIGKSLIGYVLYGFGAAAVIAGFIFCFLRTEFFKEGRVKPLILGLALGVFLAAGLAILLTGSSSAGMPTGASGGFPQMQGAAGTTSSGSFTPPSGMTGESDSSGSFTPPSGMMNGASTTSNQSGTDSSTSGLTSSSSSRGNMPARSGSAGRIIPMIAGWSLLGAGVILGAVLAFKAWKKKMSLAGMRWQVLFLGFVIGALLASGAVVMFAGSSSAPVQMQAMPAAVQTSSTSTDTSTAAQSTSEAAETPSATPTALSTATPAETAETPEATATADSGSLTRVVACLDADIRAGIYIHKFPREDSAAVGSIPLAGCFALDGKASAYPGWYRLAAGQNGYMGISIWGDEKSQDLWVYAVNTDATESNLNSLPEITVTQP